MLSAVPWASVTLPSCSPNYSRASWIGHCFCNIPKQFSRWKVAFSALIKLQTLNCGWLLNKNRMICFSKTHLFLQAYICEWQNKCIKMPHISHPAQNICLTCHGKSLLKSIHSKWCSLKTIWGYSSHFEGLARETTTCTFWFEQLLKMELKLHDIGPKCWFSKTVADLAAVWVDCWT